MLGRPARRDYGLSKPNRICYYPRLPETAPAQGARAFSAKAMGA